MQSSSAIQASAAIHNPADETTAKPAAAATPPGPTSSEQSEAVGNSSQTTSIVPAGIDPIVDSTVRSGTVSAAVPDAAVETGIVGGM